MAEKAGYGGEINFYVSDADEYLDMSDSTHNIFSWSLTLEADLPEVTTFTDAGWRTYLKGQKSWTVSCEAYVDATNAIEPSDVGARGKLMLATWSDTTAGEQTSDWGYRGKAFLRAWNPTVNVDGVETQTLEFTGHEDLTFSDAGP